MRLNRFDLNLLVALDALLTEKNTTRAGKRINLSQPAMSCALARLRSYFNDPILTQVGRNLVATPLGTSLAQPVRELLMRTEATLDSRPNFDPGTTRRKFRVMLSDYVSTVFMAEVARRTERVAPGMTFEILPHGLSPETALESGDIDLLLMPDEFLPREHPSEALFEEHYVVVAWAQHPTVGRQLSQAQYLELRHVVARPGAHPQRRPAVDELYFERLGHERHIDVVVGEFNVLPQYVLGTSRVATMHHRLARLYARHLPLKIVPLPFKCPPIREAIAWHSHRDQDLGLAWVREQFKATAAELDRIVAAA
ncbi:MAG TPA: LysR family transcriptional regulator [Steroidobacteraceae bacterium]|jgi:DNA-binding transcriptional LysR family regulator